ncbi:hypothetical protein N9L47_05835 [Rhodobacteraceae bacterium]|nr:hypothetical protein [Paracoccaceae bacterium]
MPLQNRVLATGDIVAASARGLFMGNRGILHDGNQALARARWKHKAWVTCVLKHRDWHRTVMSPGAYTELFFLDEAVALAAGHRPCAMCRHSDYTDYRAAAGMQGAAKDMDAKMHKERAEALTFRQKRHLAEADTLPDGAIIFDGVPKMVVGDALKPVTANGYGAPQPRIQGSVTVLTPVTSLAALNAGYKPVLHPTA